MDPRIFGIPALRAPVVAIIRRGPSGWMHVGRWDLETPTYEPGAWLGGTIYPQRCDLSPDGRWLVYFALKPSARWALGTTYIAISRLPWLAALAGWADGTWTRGVHFVEDRTVWEVSPPDLGDLGPVRKRFGMRPTRDDSFAVERRRGWNETADTPPRAADEAWDERRGDRIVIERARPKSDGSTRLSVRGTYVASRQQYGIRTDVRYELQIGARTHHLEDVQWADWDLEGGSWSRAWTGGCRSATLTRMVRLCGRGTRLRSNPTPHRRPRKRRLGEAVGMKEDA